MAEIWEGKWVKDTDSDVFVFLGACFNFLISFVVRCPHKTRLNRDLNHSGTAASVDRSFTVM